MSDHNLRYFDLQNSVNEALEQLKAEGIAVIGIAANVSKSADIKMLVDLAVSTYGRIDVVISNAAVNPFAGSILDTPDWAVDKLFDVNVKSPIQLLREVRPHMSKVCFPSQEQALHSHQRGA